VTAEPIIRVLCVEDHQIVRDGIALILARQPDMRVVASAATATEAVDTFRRVRPDVVLMDLQLGATSGVQAIHDIRAVDPSARIIVLTMFQGDEDIFRAMKAGAATYLLKDTLTDDLVRFIREVYAGRNVLPRVVRARLAERQMSTSLTPREIQVLELVAQGLRNREIADRLGISDDTTHVHLKNILAKLEVDDRTAATVVALRRGIIQLK
jgi:DNA-binding NarL/FixJ family response regulator